MIGLMLVGHGRAGKDLGLAYLEAITTLKSGGSTSLYLTKYVAKKLGVSEEEAHTRRHESDEMRLLWFNTGNEIREGDPGLLIREALENGPLVGGVRDMAEVLEARRMGILLAWVANNRVKPDPTVKFTSRECDVVIENHWRIRDYYERLARFAEFAGLPLRKENESRFCLRCDRNVLVDQSGDRFDRCGECGLTFWAKDWVA